jgi:hypothetical protein
MIMHINTYTSMLMHSHLATRVAKIPGDTRRKENEMVEELAEHRLGKRTTIRPRQLHFAPSAKLVTACFSTLATSLGHSKPWNYCSGTLMGVVE